MLKNFNRVQINVGLDKTLVDLIDKCFPMSSRSFAVRYILVDYFVRNGLYEVKDDFLHNSRS